MAEAGATGDDIAVCGVTTGCSYDRHALCERQATTAIKTDAKMDKMESWPATAKTSLENKRIMAEISR
jgi:hypothetical protein